jgi:hypothetical protein
MGATERLAIGTARELHSLRIGCPQRAVIVPPRPRHDNLGVPLFLVQKLPVGNPHGYVGHVRFFFTRVYCLPFWTGARARSLEPAG